MLPILVFFLNTNPEFSLGEKVGFHIEDWFAFIHPDDRARLRRRFSKVKEERTGYQFEYRIIRSDGSIRWMMGLTVSQ